jgi:hypothetical protein
MNVSFSNLRQRPLQLLILGGQVPEKLEEVMLLTSTRPQLKCLVCSEPERLKDKQGLSDTLKVLPSSSVLTWLPLVHILRSFIPPRLVPTLF